MAPRLSRSPQLPRCPPSIQPAEPPKMAGLSRRRAPAAAVAIVMVAVASLLVSLVTAFVPASSLGSGSGAALRSKGWSAARDVSSVALLAESKSAGGDSSTSAVARERFIKVLAEKGGDWRDPAVTAELSTLEEANPTVDAALSGTYLDANWLQVTRPDYNYGGNKGSTEYTLGALSFNMFEPNDMKVEVEQTTQLVAPNEDGTREWDISLLITCVDERYPPFKANITTFGKIQPGKDKDGKNRRLEVWFTEGKLKPASGTDDAMRKQWLDTFRTAQKEKKRTVGTMLKNGMLRLMMGLRLPDSVADDGTVSFKMNRPPHGYTDILYIDDKLRVTRGNRGSIVAVTREGP